MGHRLLLGGMEYSCTLKDPPYTWPLPTEMPVLPTLVIISPLQSASLCALSALPIDQNGCLNPASVSLSASLLYLAG